MIFICPPDNRSLAKAVGQVPGAPFSWVYLGQSPAHLKRAGLRFDPQGTFLDATPRFHQAAAALREPYLAYLYRIGQKLASLSWWLSSLSCRGGVISKSFQQVCHLKAALDLVRSWQGPEPLVLVVDRTLLPALARNLEREGTAGVRLLGIPRPLFLRPAGDLFRMLAHRAFFLSREAYRIFQSRRLVSRPQLTTQPATILFCWATPDSIRQGGDFHKAFFGDLAAGLEKLGSHVAVVPIIWKELRYTKALRKLRQTSRPLLVPHRYLGLADIFRAAISSAAKPALPSPVPALEGMDIDSILQLDLRQSWVSNGAADALLTRALIRRWAALGFCIDRFIYVFENQPYERSLCWEAKRSFPRSAIVGYQHARAPWMAINMYLAPGGEREAPQPDWIVTVGKHTARLLSANGHDPNRVKVGGALQMESFFQLRGAKEHSLTNHDEKTVLVAVSSRPEEAAELVDMAANLFDEGAGVQVVLKCHPVMPFEAVSSLHVSELPKHVRLSNDPINQLMLKCSVVVYTSSVSSVQALALGLPVVHLRTQFDFDLDPLDSVPSARLEARGLGELRQRVRWLLDHREEYVAQHLEEWSRFVEEMYGPVTEETYRAFLEPGAALQTAREAQTVAAIIKPGC